MGEQKLRIPSVATHTHDCARPSCQPMDLDSGLPGLSSPTLPTTPTLLLGSTVPVTLLIDQSSLAAQKGVG